MKTIHMDLDLVNKALVSMIIEKNLLHIGKPVYEEVLSRLNKKYHCYLPDCYEYPEYLSEILKEVFGDAHKVIVKEIRKELEEFSDQERVGIFLEVINRSTER